MKSPLFFLPLLLASACANTAVRQPASAPITRCEQAGRPAWVQLGEEKLCGHVPSARQADADHLAAWIKQLQKELGADKNGQLPEDAECDGAKCSLYSGAQTKYQLAQKMGPPWSALTFHEVFSLLNYAEWGYQSYNKALWSGQADPQEAASIRSTINALLKLPARPGTTYRGEIEVHMEEDLAQIPTRILALQPPGGSLERPLLGHKFFFKGFSSTTLGTNEGSRNYITGRGISFEVEGKSGRYIAPLSSREGEEEVLFPPGTWFEVTSIKKVSRKKTEDYPLDFQWRVKLREL